MAERLSHYELLERLGTGGMGTVWRARDVRDGRVVAVKLLHAHLAADAEYIRRFQREARIASTIDSPYVIRVIETGHEGESHFLVMEYVDGKTLSQHIHEQGRLSVDETVKVATAIASGLAAAHALGIVHRDVSPQNVMLGADGSIKLTDFGVARDLGATAMTATSMLLGKPQYIAPEVVTGQAPVDIRSDIYALGVVMYQMLTGKVPFEAETPYAVMQMQVHSPPPALSGRSDLPPWLSSIVACCLAKRPAERYQTPAVLISDLAARRGVSGTRPRVASHRGARRPAMALFGLGGIAVLGVIGAAFAFTGESGANDDSDSSVGAFAPSAVETSSTEGDGIADDAVAAPEGPLSPDGSESPEPELTAPPLPDRTTCRDIQADPVYRSDAERTFFLASCRPTPVPALPATPTPVQQVAVAPTNTPSVVRILSYLSCSSSVHSLSVPGGGALRVSRASPRINCNVTFTGQVSPSQTKIEWRTGPDIANATMPCGCGLASLTQQHIDFTSGPDRVIVVKVTSGDLVETLSINLVAVE